MVDIDLSEVVDLARILEHAPEQAARVAHEAGIAVGAVMQAGAKAAAPRDTGDLATKGIRRRTWKSKEGSHTDVFTIPVQSGGELRNVGFFVEYGTSTTPPNPFLSSQMVAGAPAFEAAIIAGLDPLGGKGA